MRTSSAGTAGPARPRVLSLLTILLMLAAGLVALGASAPTASASHFRANQLTWHLKAGTTDTVEFHSNAAVRASIYPGVGVGGTVNPFCLDFGDGTFCDLSNYAVTALDSANDILYVEAHVEHTYAGSAPPYTASISNCCRLEASDGHVNNGGGALTIETLVNLAGTSASPISSISPIVDCPLNAVCNFSVPAIDPDGQGLVWRLASAAESSLTQPVGATINATTGQYSWDTTGATLNTAPTPTFYSTQVVIENLVGSTVVAKIAVDFFIRLGTGTSNQAPVFTSPTPADAAIILGTVGTQMTFGAAATDPDSADTVTLAMINTPGTATYSTTAGNPASGTFTWTPMAVGDTFVVLTATDGAGLQALQRSITLRVGPAVTPPTNTPPTAAAGGPYSGVEGSSVSLSGTAGDVDAGNVVTTAWSYVAPGVDAGAACTFANATALSTTVSCTDDGPYTLTLSASDGTASTTSNASLTISNAAPGVTITSPADLSEHTTSSVVNVAASLTDAGANDTHTCSVNFGDGSAAVAGTVSAGTCTASKTYAAPGVFTITVTVTDDDMATGTESLSVVVSQVSTRKVTGGGFVVSNGRVSFGFVAHSDLRGQLQVRLPGHSRFHGSTVTALTSTANTATWSGAGRLDGVPGYTFTVSVVDNGSGGGKQKTPDTITITIRTPGGATVFSTSGPLKGGNLTVHRS